MIKVAIVEDRSELRELWQNILNHTDGFICIGAYANFEDAVKNLSSNQADVVLMDINLSHNSTGIDCVRYLRPICTSTQYLMFTIFEDNDNIFEALRAGASGYILKNTTPTKVLDAIEELHNGGSPMSAGIARRVLQSFHPKAPFKYSDEIEKLTVKENQILERLAKGLFYKEIAAEMTISIGMIKQNLHAIYKKLHVANRTEAINKFLKR